MNWVHQGPCLGRFQWAARLDVVALTRASYSDPPGSYLFTDHGGCIFVMLRV